MTISSSLNAGVAGLNVNASKLATISDNIANSKTYGYKRVDADFSSMTLSSNAGSYTAGGVRVAIYRDVAASGALVTTSNPMDIAIAGRGMLPVTSISSLQDPTGNFPLLLSSTGSFYPNKDGFLESETGLVLLGWPADGDGEIPPMPRDTAAGLEPVNIAHNQFAANPTTEVGLGINLPATATKFDASGNPLEISLEYFDNLGTTQTMRAVFVPQIPAAGQSNAWTVQIIDEATGAAPIAEFEITFDDTTGNGGAVATVTPIFGATYDPLTGVLGVTFDRGPVDISIGAVGETTHLTQLSSQFAPISLYKNGSPTGNFISVEIDENGYVMANYDSGYSRRIYQIPVADVANMNGLEALSNQTYAITRDSGPLFFWDASTGPVGATIGFSREESTTDIAAELTQLIQTQRAYSSNAKIIQTVDEMLQETTNIKR